MIKISEVSGFWMEDDCPLVAVSGKWLRDYGFEIGCKIVIDISEEKIVIKRVYTEG